MKTTRNVDTKPNARATAITTNVTFDWEGVTETDYRNMAESWATIKLQIGWRKNGIPTDATCNVKDIVPGTRAPRGPVNVVAIAATMTPEQRAALMAQIAAMDADDTETTE